MITVQSGIISWWHNQTSGIRKGNNRPLLQSPCSSDCRK